MLSGSVSYVLDSCLFLEFFFNILENGDIEIVLFMWYVSGYFINPL